MRAPLTLLAIACAPAASVDPSDTSTSPTEISGTPTPPEPAETTEPVDPTEPPEREPAALWSPAPGTPWHWQLSGRVDPTTATADMVDLDLFESLRPPSTSSMPTVAW